MEYATPSSSSVTKSNRTFVLDMISKTTMGDTGEQMDDIAQAVQEAEEALQAAEDALDEADRQKPPSFATTESDAVDPIFQHAEHALWTRDGEPRGMIGSRLILPRTIYELWQAQQALL